MSEAHLPSLLAAITEADHPSLVFWALGSIGALAVFIDRATAIWDRFRSKPPASEVYVTKAEFKELEEKVDILASKPYVTRQELSEVRDRADELMQFFRDAIKEAMVEVNGDLENTKKEAQDVNKALQAIHRTLGQLEGTVEAWKK